jgi:type I restriction enzyme R subunit
MFTEHKLEKAVIELFTSEKIPHFKGDLFHRESSDVLLRDDLKQFLFDKYSDDAISLKEIERIILQLELFPSSALYESNKSILKLLADGFTLKREDRSKKDLFIQLIDYTRLGTTTSEIISEALPLAAEYKVNYDLRDKNIYRFVTQMEIRGFEKRIPDCILYINGLPLVVMEFKSAINENASIRNAYTQLTVRYRRDIPELLKYNAFCVISDGVNNKIGSLFSQYDYFYSWRKIHPEDEPVEGLNSLNTMIKGLFSKNRLLDVIRNFIYFPDTSKNDGKIVCRYPQYYAAIKLFKSIKKKKQPLSDGKGGTYFGATGSGKSYTMLFLTRLLMKSLDFHSPTIVLITDRTDLDDQLSALFTNSKIFIGDENVVSVESRDELKTLLQNRKSGGVFLTTIQKFTEDTDLLTSRNNVICISDEAHRSQVNLEQKISLTKKGLKRGYGFAKFLHKSLPNATYVGFTGTPIDATLDVFGEIVDAYTMKESVEDEITVKIVYEGRAAKVLLNDEKLKEIEKYYKKCEVDGSNARQILASKRAMTRMEVILGDPSRLKLVGKDFVDHYETRVKEGATVCAKAIFVCNSRSIAFSLYQEIINLRSEWAEKSISDHDIQLTDEEKRVLKPVEKLKMVMTRDKDDPKELYDLLGSKDIRKELDRQFKEINSNFKIAIVVDMWLTGFDVPCLDTIYIDKPIRQHSLIQTISRVNRVFEGKEMGLVVDYIGIKNNLNLALKKYSKIHGDDFEDIDKAVALVKDQMDLLSKLFYNFESKMYFSGTPLQQLNCLNRAVEYVQNTKEIEKRFSLMIRRLRSAYNLCCGSEKISPQERDIIHFYFAIRAILHKLVLGNAPDTSQMNDKVREMIKAALVSEGIEEILLLRFRRK